MEPLTHPTHHRPFLFVCGGCAVGGVIAYIGSAMILDNPKLAMLLGFGIFAVIVIAGIIWTNFYCRHCTCPRCGKRLDRHKTAPRGENWYLCESCGVAWQSQIVAIGSS